MSFGIVGYYPVFRALQYRVRQDIKLRIKRRVPEGQLHEIAPLSEGELEWVRPGKEFRYKDNMYDVVRTGLKHGRTVYYCINDKEEKALFTTLDELVKDQVNEKNSSHSKASKSFHKIFFNLFFSSPIYGSFYLSVKEINFVFSEAYSDPYLQRKSPPPECC